MDSQYRTPRNILLLFEPTSIIISAIEMKNAIYEIADYPRKTLLEVPGPALRHEHLTIVGEDTILHWLDRRFPWPILFPSQEEAYAKAGTLITALKHNPKLAIPIWEAHSQERQPHILGNNPSLVDLYLLQAMNDIEHGEVRELSRRVKESIARDRAAYE